MRPWGDKNETRGTTGVSALGLAFENWKASKGIGVGPEIRKEKKENGKEAK